VVVATRRWRADLADVPGASGSLAVLLEHSRPPRADLSRDVATAVAATIDRI
jgi:hypothetical protein